MFEVPIASEVTNLINFLTLDLVLLPYIMHVSGLLAGFANHSRLRNGRTLRLVVFDIPLVGGGIVMSRCWQRTFLIWVRLSVVAAVAICNFGLEGRSRTNFVTQEATVRIPGVLNDSFADIYSATERRLRCSDSEEDGSFKFGSVIDDKCYLDLAQHIYVTQVAFNTTDIMSSAVNCKRIVRCPAVATTFRCDGVDLVCGGLPRDSPCRFASGVQLRTCVSVVYDQSGGYGYICLDGWLRPGYVSKRANCRWFQARYEYVKDWVNHYLWATNDPLVAIFGSAYGREARKNVTVPQSQKNVTVVQASWLAPMLWVLCVSLVLTLWWLLQCMNGSHVVAHDERGLTKLLNKQIVVGASDDWEFQEPRRIALIS